MRPSLCWSLYLPLVAAVAPLEPCAIIADQVTESQTNNGSSAPVLVPAQLAEKCLKSIPFYPKLAATFIDELAKYMQWQSTLEALKNPPKSYLSTSVDILGGLNTIRETKYKSQWDFDLAIKALLNGAHDGHLKVSLCSQDIFTFIRKGAALVSVSETGTKAPEIYLYTDAILINNTQATVSPVVSIDGQDPVEYLEAVADAELLQDPDARYNRIFYSIDRFDDPLSYGSFYKNAAFSNNSITTLEFYNGSTIEFQNAAKAVEGFVARDGQDLFERYCLPRSTSQPEPIDSSGMAGSQGSVLDPPVSGPVGYPQPFLRDPYNQVNGYWLDDDTVVLQLPTFSTTDLPKDQPLVVAEAATDIVLKALADGRTKIIIDVSSNGGGLTTRAWDTFKLFFPDKFPYSASRFRRHTAVEGLVKVFTLLNESMAVTGEPFALAGQVTPDQKHNFSSYKELLGNETELGVKVSSLYANMNYTLESGRDDLSPIRGYGGRPLLKTQPFKSENILIVTDSGCSSTCAVFVNLMTNIGGVRAISFGGRPRKKPMQSIGGVRGSNVLSFQTISDYVSKAVALYQNNPQKLGFISEKEIAEFKDTAPRSLKEFPLILSSGSVNLRNAYQEGDDDLPLQFQYQAADCRLYYTIENIFRPETTWKAAKNAIWGNRTCVEGSTGGAGSLEDKKNKEKQEPKDNTGYNKDDKDEPENEADRAFVGWSILSVAFAILMSLA
ncbi:hypothetical protein FSARC_3157 [Fusarium sarcochroum]|uniref:CPAF-like PDZ domain-containing protein n=1 Tax=Fusarium sarcochroum TaxID=1208366 RepID=A0A8H4U4T4_9HYPO|nr:hypothetical protein FSARC_3157 [Fusarium sarcochroum]